MTNDSPSRKVHFTDQMVKDLKRLGKKHPAVRQDINGFIEALQQGQNPGDRIPGTGQWIIYKVRLKMSNSQKGKSGGYRIIYWLETPEAVILLTMYAKSDKENITISEIREIVTQYSEQSQSDEEGE